MVENLRVVVVVWRWCDGGGGDGGVDVLVVI